MRRRAGVLAVLAGITLAYMQHAPAGAAQANAWRDSGHAIWGSVPSWIRSLGYCIRQHESIHAGHYQADNPVSSASGAYQFLQATWSGNARWARWQGRYVARPYAHLPASAAPAFVQDIVFVHAIRNGGAKAWAGTDCPGTA